jgi:hypothetical protein
LRALRICRRKGTPELRKIVNYGGRAADKNEVCRREESAMRIRIRALVAALATAALIFSLAAPAAAFTRDTGNAPNQVPAVIDVLLLRPIGLLMTATGVALYVFPVAPMTMLVRPLDIAKPLGPLVVKPGRFTFADPIGYHP